MRLIVALVLALSCLARADLPFATEKEFVNEFYETVQGCPEQYSKLLKLRTMVTNDMIWKSADNVTFIGGDIFCIYTCWPFSGVSMYDRDIIIERAEWVLRDAPEPRVERHYNSNNFLLYNITKDPIFGNEITPVTTFFKEADDFVLVRNPSYPRTGSRYLISEISSYASPRDFYRVLGWFVNGIVPPTKRTPDQGSVNSGVKFWPLIQPNTVIDAINITIADLAPQ